MADDIVPQSDNPDSLADNGQFGLQPDTPDEASPPARRPLWRRRWFVWCVCLLVIAGIGTLGGLPTTRYWILNHAKVRSSANMTLVDEITEQPLQYVQVRAAGVTAYSDADGRAVLRGLRLGPTTLTISRPGFADIHRQVTLGWGSNPFDLVRLKATGMSYRVTVTDWLSGKPVKGAHVESDVAAAITDGKGRAILVLPNDQAIPEITVTVRADDYRTQNITAKAAGLVTVGLVTARKAVYVSKQSGTYDVYTRDADGQNPQVILPGTGNENPNISLVVSPDGTEAALVSTRSKQYDADGYPLSTLTLIDVATGDSVELTHADQIQLIDWIGTTLVFEQSMADGPHRYTVSSYDYATSSRYQLATAAKFSTVLSAGGNVYYALAPGANDPSVRPYLYRVAPDGSSPQTLLEKEVWGLYRTAFDSLSVQTADEWYAHTISTKRNAIIPAPSSISSKLFLAQPAGGKASLWVDIREGKPTLLLHGADDSDAALDDQPGITYPVRWLTADSTVVRVVNGAETADYAIGATPGQQPHKIADVANTFGYSIGQ